jgi:hypothetical protein
VSLADDVERLKQRHARLHHGRHLPGEERHVLVGHLAAPADALLRNLGDDDALAAQRNVHQCRAASAHLSLDQLAGLVLAFPKVGSFLDLYLCGCCGCHGVPCFLLLENLGMMHGHRAFVKSQDFFAIA